MDVGRITGSNRHGFQEVWDNDDWILFKGLSLIQLPYSFVLHLHHATVKTCNNIVFEEFYLFIIVYSYILSNVALISDFGVIY